MSKTIEMSSPAIYRITIKGKLDKSWSEWFNGTIITVESETRNKPLTNLTCKVRDQSELLGILNHLFNLNLPLLRVEFVRVIKHSRDIKKGVNHEQQPE